MGGERRAAHGAHGLRLRRLRPPHGDLRWGEVVGDDLLFGDDERITRTTYFVDTARWLMVPLTETVEGGQGTLLRKQESFYDGEPYVGLPLGEVGLGYLTRVRQWLGPHDDRWRDSERYAYDAFGNRVGHMDALGNVREVDFDPETHTFAVADRAFAGGRVLQTTAGYDMTLGLMSTYTEPNGHTTRLFYDALGRLTSRVLPGDTEALPTEQYHYTLGAPLSSVTTERRREHGRTEVEVGVRYVDGLGRAVATLTRDGTRRWVLSDYAAFDARGNTRDAYQAAFVEQPVVEEPVGVEHERVYYDALGREVGRRLPGMARTLTVYEPMGVRYYDEEDTDPTSPHHLTATARFYDGQQQLVEQRQSIDGNEHALGYSYDALGHLETLSDAEGHVARYTHNALGWLVEIDHPDAGRWLYEYDLLGQRRRSEDATGRVVEYGYDELSRPSWEDWGGDGTREIAWHYDARQGQGADANLLGQLAWVSDLAGLMNFTYDARGRLHTRTRTIEGEAYTTQLEYDAADRVRWRTYADGMRIEHRYNARGQLERLGGYVALDYDANGLVQWRETGDGTRTAMEYDPRLRERHRRIEADSGRVLADMTIERDGVGNAVAVIDHRSGIAEALRRDATYGYDSLYRLESAQLSGGAISWTYSPSGNMLTRTGTGLDGSMTATLGYGEGSGPHALTSFMGRTVSYDEAGRAQEDGTRSFVWDARGRLYETQLSDGSVVRNVYGHDGARVVKEVLGPTGEVIEKVVYIDDATELRDGELTKYVLVGEQRVARITTEAGGGAEAAALTGSIAFTTAWWRRGGFLLMLLSSLLAAAIVWRSAARDRWQRGLAAAVLLAFVTAPPGCSCDGGGRTGLLDATYYHHDSLGSVTHLTDAGGSVVREQAYRPYGSQRGAEGEESSDYTFTGKELDTQSRLHAFPARFFDAMQSRWMSPDVYFLENPEKHMDSPAESNLYAYAR